MTTFSDSDVLVIGIVGDQPSGSPVTYSNFRMVYPQISFPELPDNSFLVDFGSAVFQYVSPPPAPQFTTVSEGAIAFNPSKGAWTNTWVEAPFTAEQMAAANQSQLAALTLQRNMLLYQCDWTQLPDVVLTPTEVTRWRVYRQELRDYISRVVDPFHPPAWPTSPQQ